MKDFHWKHSGTTGYIPDRGSLRVVRFDCIKILLRGARPLRNYFCKNNSVQRLIRVLVIKMTTSVYVHPFSLKIVVGNRCILVLREFCEIRDPNSSGLSKKENYPRSELESPRSTKMSRLKFILLGSNTIYI